MSVMLPVHVKRIEKLIEILRLVNKNNFNIQIWREQRSCGTVACAAGWAATIPEFNRDGFGFASGLSCPSYKPVYSVDKSYCEERAEKERIIKFYTGYDDFDGIALFFGLTREDANLIFSSDGYEYDISRGRRVTPAMIIRKLKKAIDKNYIT